MKKRHIVLCHVLACVLVAASTPALARHHGGRVGIGIGFGFGLPYYGYPYAYPYDPLWYPSYPYAYDYRPVAVRLKPPPSPPSDVMPEPGEGGPTTQPYYRNYCAAAGAYYPKVLRCAGGWQLR